MFVDASAVVSIISGEDDALSLSARLAQASTIYLSPIVIYESVTGLARKRACPIEMAEQLVDAFVEETRAHILDISSNIGVEALKASRKYGRGRHKADLNMGDCFAYACAKTNNLPLLFKGNDFPYTDIEVA
ncbi:MULTISPECIES: type II toxin-antitoxin system VapC family toxin [unclassified Phyllobacterium]|uniref:type II toxin-antitoxin system VapC family toxin n=1 Tax=Phyllobacterium TaxID=28100 RepID=UPI000DDC181B|nr:MULTISPECIES: type II toxin-antitoxin system VapC family toxin [unclassified Phyllobacterium]MBA8902050.1 ribonuclease VapC [Phyllobacterium sp. P30BS-XVII]UGX88848.1 type II toxin-antitoxin system VapC family toxin [Phyllobacterium sp. T1293]